MLHRGPQHGGLVFQYFAQEYIEHLRQNPHVLRLLMTANSPMNDMSAAAYGLQHSPIVVPCRRIVVSESDFLRELYAWKWPREIAYHLVVFYLDGKSGDGVIPLKSQADPRLQTEAFRMYLFNAEHTQIINSGNFQATLNRVLARTRGR